MFTLAHHKAKLRHVNPRAEMHGDEHVIMGDLKFSFLSANDLLAEFDPALKSSLYRKADGDGDQLELPTGEGDRLPKLRFPKMGPIEWEVEIIGGLLTIHHGMSGYSDMRLDVRSADNFKLELMDGGSVSVTFRVQCKPTEEQFGRLCYTVQKAIEISFEPPADDGLMPGFETAAADAAA